jgi:tRNA-Thr(GGU) m(6)t(6)A37 methyltransferase TsaA
MKYFFLFVLGALVMVHFCVQPREGETTQAGEKHFEVHPIGRIKKDGGRPRIIIDDKFQPGLLGLDKFSHIYVLYWFDRNDTPEKRSILQVHPKKNKNQPLAGVFATRAPVRPNLIALSLCELVSVRENVLEVEAIDAFDNTPVLDIKPYIRSKDSPQGVCEKEKQQTSSANIE